MMLNSMEEVIPTSGRFGTRTCMLEKKALACKMLRFIASELKGGLHLWISEFARALIPLLNFRFDEEIRLNAVTAMPLLLHSTIAAMEGRPRSIIPALAKALNKFSGSQLRKINVIQFVDGITEVLAASSFKKTERQESQCRRFRCRSVLKEKIEQEEKVCDKVRDCLDTSIKTFSTAFLSSFDKILPFFANMWMLRDMSPPPIYSFP